MAAILVEMIAIPDAAASERTIAKVSPKVGSAKIRSYGGDP
jgi:hypothetical protein